MIHGKLRPLLLGVLCFGLLGVLAQKTEAQTISEVPFTEDFMDVTVPELPPGWDKLENVITNSDWTEFGSDNITLQFPPNFTVGPMAILPEIHSDLDISSLELTFATYAAGTVGGADKMKVGFVSDHTDPGSFTLVQEFQMTNSIQTHTVSFSNHDEQDGRRIAFYPESGFWNRFIIDYVTLEEKPGVTDPPDIVTLVSPPNEAGNIGLFPEFTWAAADNAESYTFQIATDVDFLNEIALIDDIPTTSYSLSTELDLDAIYFWRVRGVNQVGNGDWSSIWSFTTTSDMEPLAGTYYIGAPGTAPDDGDPQYATLKAASDALMQIGIGGDVIFYITSDLTESENFALGVDTKGHTITFKPYSGKTPTVTFTQATDNSGWSGGWVIGINTVDSGSIMVPTNNVVIDGSNTEGGTTRDLTFVSSVGVNNYPFRIRGNCNNITIKNTNIIAGIWSVAYAIWVNPVLDGGSHVPDNLTIENNFISSTASALGTPVHVSRSGTTTEPMENLVIRNNEIIGRNRGIFLNGLTNVTTIENNTFELNQQTAGYMSSAIQGNAIFGTGVTYIHGNDFRKNVTVANNINSGIRTITASGGGSFHIANNFFSGYETGAVAEVEIKGIRCGSFVEAYNNTIVMNDVAASGGRYRGISIAAGSPIFKNNIIITEEDDFTNYCITGTPGESNFNNFYRTGTNNARIGLFTGLTQATLQDWQNASGRDVNSVSVPVDFVSENDLRLNGNSDGDVNLAGISLPDVTVDIDGTERDGTNPYMGAFEGTPFGAALVHIDGASGWRMISVPVIDATVADLASKNQVQGIEGVADVYDNPPSTIETDAENLFMINDENQWAAPNHVTDILQLGRGYIWYLYNNSEGVSTPLPFKLSVAGLEETEDVTVALHSSGNKFNLLGNPYQSSLDLSGLAEWPGANGLGSYIVQVWENSQDGWQQGTGHSGEWKQLGPDGVDGDILAAWQGFMVENDNAAQLVIPESARTSGGTFYKESPPQIKRLTLVLDGDNRSTGIRTRDRAHVVFSDQAAHDWDMLDASQLTPLAGSFATLSFVGDRNGETILKSQESRPFELEKALELPASLNVHNMGGDMAISWIGLDELPSDWQITLVDHETGTATDLRSASSYEFRMDAPIEKRAMDAGDANPVIAPLAASDLAQPRFSLIVEPEIVSTEMPADLPNELTLNQNYPNPFNPSTVISYALPEQAHVRLTIYDLTGRRISSLVNEQQGPGRYDVTWDASQLASGVYIYRLEAGGQVLIRKMTFVK